MNNIDLDKYFVSLLAAPFVLMALVAAAVFMVSFKPALTKHDQEILGFTFEQPVIVERVPTTSATLTSPIGGVAGQKQEFPLHPLTQLAPPPAVATVVPKQAQVQVAPPVARIERSARVSFILINERGKMAIVNGQVVHEGDALGKRRIGEIRRDRVSLLGKEGEKWLLLR
jgi:hypothetical protein